MPFVASRAATLPSVENTLSFSLAKSSFSLCVLLETVGLTV
jgi:hypothetical protein